MRLNGAAAAGENLVARRHCCRKLKLLKLLSPAGGAATRLSKSAAMRLQKLLADVKAFRGSCLSAASAEMCWRGGYRGLHA